MSIRTYCSQEDPGAFCIFPSPTPYLREPEEPRADGLYYRKEPADDPCLRIIPESVGTTVALRERNMHDDSDFFATYFDGKEFVEYMYGTTRGWSYTSGASIDATPEIQKLYQEHQEATRRRWKAVGLKQRHRDDLKIAAKCNLRIKQVRELRRILGERAEGVFRLLGTKKFRSSFRESMAKQVRNWVSGERRYSLPLSPKQLEYVY